jgi:SpoVK/Ycf46/Vps4 family AAA+-type ATPase
MVTCGDMGTDPDTLEWRLQETFLRAANWKAILLLDEADVFIAKRDSYDLKRNALVSIFLRHLEYSEGLLFMTTNRREELDPALESRIHMALELPVFDIEAQKFVWLSLIESLEDLRDEEKLELRSFIKKDLQELDGGAYLRMNGRQIRNCMSAALALAQGVHKSSGSGGRLKSRHIEDMLRLGKEFRDYLNEKLREFEQMCNP